MRYSIILAMVMLISFGVAYAEPQVDINCLGIDPAPPLGSSLTLLQGNTAIRMKASDIIVEHGRVSGDTLFIERDGVIKFPIEYVNRDSNSYNGGSAIEIYSPDGATWAHATGDGGNFGFSPDRFGLWVDTTGFYPKSAFPVIYRFGCFGCDGAGGDTVSFSGAGGLDGDGNPTLAIRPLDSAIHFYVIVRAKLSDTGKHICIDSVTNTPPSCTWGWPAFNYLPAFNTKPAWGGQFCFVLAKEPCCRGGFTGNVDCSPDDLVDISDLSEYIDSHYLNVRFHCCPAEANMDGSPDGGIDISDLTALIDYLYISFTPLAPCL